MNELRSSFLQSTSICHFTHLCFHKTTVSHHPQFGFFTTLPPVESEQPGDQSITSHSFAHRHRLQPRGRLFNQTQSHPSCWSQNKSALPGSDCFDCCCEMIENTWILFFFSIKSINLDSDWLTLAASMNVRDDSLFQSASYIYILMNNFTSYSFSSLNLLMAYTPTGLNPCCCCNCCSETCLVAKQSR